MPYKYKLKEGHNPDETFIPGVSISKEGDVESATPLESSILELVSAPEAPAEQPAAAPVQAVAPAPAVQAVAPAAPAPQVTTNTENKEQQ